jgi:hypothetical protein
MPVNMTIAGRMAAIADVQRSYLWEWTIPDIKKVTSGIIDQEGLIVRVKNASLPGRSNEIITAVFMGTDQDFPSRIKFDKSVELTIDETEDQMVAKAIYEWQQNIFDIDPMSPTAGHSKVGSKKDYSTKSILRMYKFNGDKLPYDFVMYNSWPSAAAAVQLDMAATDALKRTLTLSFDYWKLEKSK